MAKNKAVRETTVAGTSVDSWSRTASGAVPARIVVGAAFVLLALTSLFPHLQTGFTTKDDTELALQAGNPERWIEAASSIAASQGRFYQLFTLIGNYLVHYSTSPVCYYSLYLGSILLNIVVFYFLVRTIFQSKLLAVLAAALSLAYLQNNWQHSLLTSYPVMPTLGLTNLFLAAIFLFKWQGTHRLRFAILAGVTYFFAILEYEILLPYFLIFLVLGVYGALSSSDKTLKQKIWLGAQHLSPVISALVVYLVWYAVFRFHNPSQYDGSQLASRGLWSAVAVIWQYTTSTLPGYFYFRDSLAIAATFDGFSPHAVDFAQLIERCRPEWLVKAVVATGVCSLILLQRARIFTAKSFLLAMAGGGACVLAPVSPLGITEKYQSWVLDHGSLAYVPSYYAYFATIFLISAILLFLNQKMARWRLLSAAYIAGASVAVAAASLTTDYYNHYITLDQKLSHLKWRTIDRLIRTDDFKAVRDDSVILAPSLWRHRGIVANGETYWSDYLTQKTGKRIWVARNAQQFTALALSGGNRRTYFLAFEQEPKDPDQFVVFSELGNRNPVIDGPVYAEKFSLFSYSKNRNFTLVGECFPNGQPIKVDINGRAADEVEGNIFFARVDQSASRDDFPKATITSTVPIDIAHLVVSFFPVEPGREGIEIVYGRGFHGLEENTAAGVVWNWSLAESELSFVSYSERSVVKSIQFQLIVFTPRTVSIQIDGVREEIRFETAGAKAVTLPNVLLQPGQNKLSLSSDQPAQPPGNGDSRLMAFGVQNLLVSDPGK
jgi:hypothetical protein